MDIPAGTNYGDAVRMLLAAVRLPETDRTTPRLIINGGLLQAAADLAVAAGLEPPDREAVWGS